MRHQKTRHKLSRDAAHRKALLQNLCKEVIQHERIKTSEAKAKAVKPELEELITLAKRGDLHARRQALQRPGPGQVHGPQALRGGRPALRRAPRRLHPHPQAGPPSQRRDGDGLPRAGLSTGRRAGLRDGQAARLPACSATTGASAPRGASWPGPARAAGRRAGGRRTTPTPRRSASPRPSTSARAAPRRCWRHSGGRVDRPRGAAADGVAAPRPPRAAPTARLDLEYDGGAFAGWARQPGRRTVQGELERALAVLVRAPVVLSRRRADGPGRPRVAPGRLLPGPAGGPAVAQRAAARRRRRARLRRRARRLRRPPRRPRAHLRLPAAPAPRALGVRARPRAVVAPGRRP